MNGSGETRASFFRREKRPERRRNQPAVLRRSNLKTVFRAFGRKVPALEIFKHDGGLAVRYRRPQGGKRREFDLCLRYLNGTEVCFTLSVERGKNGKWKVLQAVVDAGESAMGVEAVQDFAFLRWYIFPKKERGRVLPPVVALWDVSELTVAACLPPERGGKALPLAQQERWFSGDPESEPPDPGRLLCWWPDPAAWEVSRKTAETLKLVPANAVDVSFYTFSQWKQRADTKRELERLEALLREGTPDAELPDREDERIIAEIMADTLAEDYASYVRRVRTSLAFFKKRGIPVRVTLGDTARASEIFASEGLDPHNSAAWAQVSSAFPEMPDFVLEEYGSCGPLGVVRRAGDLKAAITCYSHWPDSPVMDMAAAAVCMGSQHLVNIACWLNPLKTGDSGAVEKAVDALCEELQRRGVKKIAMIDGVFPFEVCPCCGEMISRVPDEWTAPAPVRVEKVGRNDPCPCGSGLKYKKCCGRFS